MENLKIKFWKLRVHVDRNNEICVDMNNSFWELDGSNNVWHRKESPTIKLDYQVCLFESPDRITEVDGGLNQPIGGIKVEDGAISFSNKHFLRIKGVVPPKRPTMPEESVSPEDFISIAPKIKLIKQGSQEVELLTGRNIHVETTFSTIQNTQNEAFPRRVPLFYLEQKPVENNKKYVLSFGEEHTATVTENDGTVDQKIDIIRHVYWEISGNKQVNTGDFRLCEPAKYTLTINQDYDRFRDTDDTEPPYFEFLADSVPLPMQVQEEGKDFKKVHPFKPDERLLYIGYDPDTNTTFEGSIESLVFDPNSSCEGC